MCQRECSYEGMFVRENAVMEEHVSEDYCYERTCVRGNVVLREHVSEGMQL